MFEEAHFCEKRQFWKTSVCISYMNIIEVKLQTFIGVVYAPRDQEELNTFQSIPTYPENFLQTI